MCAYERKECGAAESDLLLWSAWHPAARTVDHVWTVQSHYHVDDRGAIIIICWVTILFGRRAPFNVNCVNYTLKLVFCLLIEKRDIATHFSRQEKARQIGKSFRV